MAYRQLCSNPGKAGARWQGGPLRTADPVDACTNLGMVTSRVPANIRVSIQAILLQIGLYWSYKMRLNSWNQRQQEFSIALHRF